MHPSREVDGLGRGVRSRMGVGPGGQSSTPLRSYCLVLILIRDTNAVLLSGPATVASPPVHRRGAKRPGECPETLDCALALPYLDLGHRNKIHAAGKVSVTLTSARRRGTAEAAIESVMV